MKNELLVPCTCGLHPEIYANVLDDAYHYSSGWVVECTRKECVFSAVYAMEEHEVIAKWNYMINVTVEDD